MVFIQTENWCSIASFSSKAILAVKYRNYYYPCLTMAVELMSSVKGSFSETVKRINAKTTFVRF